MTSLEELVAALTLFSVLSLPQEWAHEVMEDAFTDEKSWVASVHDLAQDGAYALFANCRAREDPSIGLTGLNLDYSPLGLRDSSAHFEVPLRFDDDEPLTARFVAQDNVLFFDERRWRDFLKDLADRNRLRVKYPRVAGDVVLDFSLEGSRDALVAMARGCGLAVLENMLATGGAKVPRTPEVEPSSPRTGEAPSAVDRAQAQYDIDLRRAEEARAAFESALARDEEELARAQTRLRDKLLPEYTLAIRAAVGRNWVRPPVTPAHLACIVRVSQAPSGDVVTVQIVESSGNRAFDSSVGKAVWKSSPLPLPKDVSLFRRDIQFVFDPDG